MLWEGWHSNKLVRRWGLGSVVRPIMSHLLKAAHKRVWRCCMVHCLDRRLLYEVTCNLERQGEHTQPSVELVPRPWRGLDDRVPCSSINHIL